MSSPSFKQNLQSSMTQRLAQPCHLRPSTPFEGEIHQMTDLSLIEDAFFNNLVHFIHATHVSH